MELTPMIDIVFNLLVFFMVATKFKTTEGMIRAFLPKDRGPGTSSSVIRLDEVRLKLLWLDASGAPTRGDAGHAVLKIGTESLNAPGELGFDRPDQGAVWADLQQRLQALKQHYQGDNELGLPVIIDAREQVPTQVVVLALNEVVRAGIQDVTFAAPER
jgi:biopolymer transport protein ExbD